MDDKYCTTRTQRQMRTNSNRSPEHLCDQNFKHTDKR